MTSLLLASSSPRRRELLASLGVPLLLHAPDVDETPGASESATDLVYRLAFAKAQAARAVAAERGATWIIAADTTVWSAAAGVLNKPEQPDVAVGMLTALSGATHAVSTGWCLMRVDGHVAQHAVVTSEVTFRALSRAEIEAYVATGEPIDRAGAYAIQGGAAGFVAAIQGSWTGIVGLPLAEVTQALAATGDFRDRPWGQQ
jgi:septum formation protein